MSDGDRKPASGAEGEHVVVVRVGHGANCSSIGSVVDTLFATATVSAAVLAAIVAALRSEDVNVVGRDPPPPRPTPPEKAP
jgi:hypothetical protein